MVIFQLLATIFIISVLGRIIEKYRIERIPKSEVLIWLIFWLIISITIWWPKLTDQLAQLVGITRGVDLIVTASIAVIFYLLFRVFSHLHKIEKDLTALVRNLAIRDPEQYQSDSQKNDYENS